MSFHNTEVLSSLHTIYFRVYADAAARLVDGTLLSVDIGKVALQSDTSQYYILQNNSPVTWASITGSGSGSSGINYIADNNSTAADSVGDWHTYADAAAPAPVDGADAKGTGTLSSGNPIITAVPSTTGVANGQTITGVGIPSNTTVLSFVANTSITMSNPATANGAVSWSTFGLTALTITRSTISPLRGTASFLITKSLLSTQQGQGASFDFTLDSADKTKPIAITFDYVPSAGFVAGSDIVNSDILVYIYDITNNQIIQPTPYKLTTAAGFNGSYSGSFQANSNSTSYRLILHVATANASAWTFQFDNVRVGPGVGTVTGVPASDWVSYTPTISGLGAGSSTNIARYRRVGDSIEISFSIVKDGTPGTGAAQVTMSLPTGLLVDDAKIGGTSDRTVVGAAQFITSAFTSIITSTIVSNASDVIVFGNNTTGNSFVGVDFPANRTILGEATIPITGWSSNVVFSNDSNAIGSVVAAKVTTSASTGASNTVNFSVTSYDTHGAISSPGSQTRFTAPVSGYYRFSTQLITNAVTANINDTFRGYVTINDVATEFAIGRYSVQTTSSVKQGLSGETTIYMNSGDYAELNWSASVSVTLDSTALNYWSIERVSGPATIAASETIAARYVTSAAQNQVSGVNTTVVFGTKDFDTHGAMNSSTGIFTAPTAGVYDVFSVITWGTATFTSGNLIEMDLYKNGALHSTMFFLTHGATSTVPKSMNGVATVKLNAGDTININILQNDTGARALVNVGTFNWVSIKRVGN